MKRNEWLAALDSMMGHVDTWLAGTWADMAPPDGLGCGDAINALITMDMLEIMQEHWDSGACGSYGIHFYHVAPILREYAMWEASRMEREAYKASKS